MIPDSAVLKPNVRTYDEGTREAVLGAVERIVRAECTASRSPREPELELYDRYPLTDNDAAVTARVAAARNAAEEAGRVAEDIPVNHSSAFAPVMQPTLATGTEALVVASLAWLAPGPRPTSVEGPS